MCDIFGASWSALYRATESGKNFHLGRNLEASFHHQYSQPPGGRGALARLQPPPPAPTTHAPPPLRTTRGNSSRGRRGRRGEYSSLAEPVAAGRASEDQKTRLAHLNLGAATRAPPARYERRSRPWSAEWAGKREPGPSGGASARRAAATCHTTATWRTTAYRQLQLARAPGARPPRRTSARPGRAPPAAAARLAASAIFDRACGGVCRRRSRRRR